MAEDQQHKSIEDRFPHVGDQPFVDCDPWQFNACTGWTVGQSSPYISGYRTAARVLLAHIDENQRDQDLLLYPLVFLWRHCVELQLKDLIAIHDKLSEQDAASLITHNLDKLWVRARPIIIDTEPSVVTQCRAIDGIIAQLMRFDPKSTAFRYPVQADGRPSLNGLPERVNLAHLNDVMDRVAVFLDCGLVELSRRLDYKLEWEAEAQRMWG